MLALRLLLILTAGAIFVCVAAWLLSGDRRWIGRAVRTAKFSGAAALVFFAVLFLERLTH